MTTNATAIRDGVFTRAQATNTWGVARKVDMPTIDGSDLPILQVFMMAERMRPDGDANVAVPRFISTATIGISVVRGFTDPVVLDGAIDTDVDTILDAILTDLTFVGVPPAGGGLFEGVTSINRRRFFPQQGETYFIETRLELDFEYRLYFEPVVTVPLQQISVSLGGILIGVELDYDSAEASEYLPGLNQ